MNVRKYKVANTLKINNVSTKEIKADAKKELKKFRKEISSLQEIMYAQGKHSVLICLQGMDTSGKDSLIREVFKDVNVRGVIVHSFKTPTRLELKHDFLWRHYTALPAKGKIGIFNRTHYENVLVTRVHPEYILHENLPDIKSIEDIDSAFYHSRMNRINQFEKHLEKSGTIVLKFFLHLSKEEQRKRLLRRLNLPEKNWKFSAADLKERALWDAYQQCYEDVLNRTSTSYAPWYIIPADDKPSARYAVAKILLEELKKYKFTNPSLSKQTASQLNEFKKQLKGQ
ncbi:MAG: PPK2 family polyphosphate kinase [Tenacibaculum sp.]